MSFKYVVYNTSNVQGLINLEALMPGLNLNTLEVIYQEEGSQLTAMDEINQLYFSDFKKSNREVIVVGNKDNPDE